MTGRNMRVETDSLGSIEVPADRYWGAQTQRSLRHFSIGSDRIPLEMIHALALVKKAAALANLELGVLSQKKADLIVRASDEVISGKLDDHFPLHVWMTGSGSQSNMNVNEVIANRAIELSGGVPGSRDPIHPNDDVNKSQSSNDVFPTAMHITTALLFTNRLLPSLKCMRDDLAGKACAWDGIVKIGRTHMQDAVPITLGQEFSGYAAILDDDIRRLEGAREDLSQIAIGGTAVGTGLNTPEGFDALAAQKIREMTSLPFIPAPNKFAVQGSHDALTAASAALKVLATSLYKIANDIRLLSCGPRAGFHELIIPPNEPGSSIMPGKVNPTQCEAMAMVAVQVMAYDSAVSFANAGGYLEMNVYKPLMIFNITQSVRMIADSCDSFTRYLLKGMQPDRHRIDRFLKDSLMLVTALSPVIGYDKAAVLAHYAEEHHCSLQEANAVLTIVPPEEFDRLVNPSRMAHPHRRSSDE
jgi:fumarate hydratase, class II